MSSQLLIIGSVAVDTVRTPNADASDQLGGSASFAALAARNFGPICLMSAIGPDFPQELIDRLQASRIPTQNLTRTTEGKTFRWEGIYHEDLGTRESVGFELGVMATARLDLPNCLGDVRYAMMGCYDPARQMEVVAQLTPGCFIATDTIAGYITDPKHKRTLTDLYRHSSLITLDQTELKLYANTDDETQAVESIFASCPFTQYVIVKYGAEGSQLYHKDGQRRRVGVFATSPKDTTGAGDTFLGTLMAHMAATDQTDIDTVEEGMRLGAAAASITIEAFGVDALEKASLGDIQQRQSSVGRP